MHASSLITTMLATALAAGCLPAIPTYTSDGGAPSPDAAPTTGLRFALTGACTNALPTIPANCTLVVRTDDYALTFSPIGTRLPSMLALGSGSDVLAHGDLATAAMGYEPATAAAIRRSASTARC